MSARPALPRKLREHVLNFYGGVCVVTGTPSSGNDLHHLDEDHSNHKFENLIPLEATLNDSIERYRYRKNIVDARLRIDALDLQAKKKYHSGRFQQSYACNRLASFLCVSWYNQSDKAINHASRALLALRAIDCLPLVEDTLRRTVLELLIREGADPSAMIQADSKAMLALEIGSYFRDYGLLRGASDWLDLSERFLKDPKIVANSDLRQEIEFRIFQHRAILKVARGDRSVESDWAQKADDGETRYIHEFGSTNDVLWRAQFLHRDGKIDEALALIRATERNYGPIFVEGPPGSAGRVPERYSHWTYAQLKLLYADILNAKGGRRYAEMAAELIRETAATFETYKIVPTVIYPLPQSPQWRIARKRMPISLLSIERTCHEIWIKLNR